MLSFHRNYKKRNEERGINAPQNKVTDKLRQNEDGTYTCPKFGKKFEPQGITNHVN